VGIQYDGVIYVNTAILDRPKNFTGLSPTLQRPTLVLNRNWQPINVATVARALIMLWNDSVKIVDPVDYQLYDWSDWSRLAPDRGESEIRRGKQFPYQYFAAYMKADDNVPQKMKTALHKTADIACGNVPELPGLARMCEI
jgi:hypothetical protein